MAVGGSRGYMCVAYGDNLVDNWENEIGEVIPFPGWYVLHDKDIDREPHFHFYFMFPNTSTLNHAKSVFMRLTKIGFSVHDFTVEPILNLDHSWNYSIHNTSSAKAKGKFLYDPSIRTCFNNFDIGFFNQISLDQKQKMCDELADSILDYGFTNFVHFYDFVRTKLDSSYRDVVRSYSSFFKNLISGNFHIAQCSGFYEDQERRNPQAEDAEPQAEDAEPQAEDAEPQAEDAEPQAEDAEPQAEDAEPQAEDAEPQPEKQKHKPRNLVSGSYRKKETM